VEVIDEPKGFVEKIQELDPESENRILDSVTRINAFVEHQELLITLEST